MMKIMVRIYTIKGCPYCEELKDLLTKDDVNFVEVDVSLDEHQKEYDKLFEITKSDDVPIVKVGKQILVPNVSFKTIQECCDLTKKFLNT